MWKGISFNVPCEVVDGQNNPTVAKMRLWERTKQVKANAFERFTTRVEGIEPNQERMAFSDAEKEYSVKYTVPLKDASLSKGRVV